MRAMQYLVKSLAQDGSLHTEYVSSVSREEAFQEASRRGMKPLSVRTTGRGGALGLLSRARTFPLVMFSQELLTLLSAGLSLVESLETLAEKEAQPDVKHVLDELVAALYRGQSFSDALRQHADVFPPLYVATVQSSEKSGALEDSLGKYIAYATQIDVARRKIISSSIYPAILGVVGLGVIGFLLGYVVPRFAKVFEEIGGDIPWMSRLLIQWGHFAQDNGRLLVVLLLVLFAGVVAFFTRGDVGRRLIRLLQFSRRIREQLLVYELSRFYRSLGMLLRGGIAILPAIRLVAGQLPEDARWQLKQAEESIRGGMAISEAMERHGLATAVSTRMLRVGEKTGRMGEMMDRVAGFYDAQITQWIDYFVRMFEPILMSVIGLVIGTIVALMYFPIFELAGSIK